MGGALGVPQLSAERRHLRFLGDTAYECGAPSLLVSSHGTRSAPATLRGEAMNHFLFHLTIVIALGSIAGCQPVASSATNGTAPVEHLDPDDVPITEADVKMPTNYAAAVGRVTEFRDAIRGAIASGHHSRAHRPLDEADIVLRRLPEIARDSGVPRRYWEQIVIAAEDLNELWGEIHSAIDAHQTPDYSSLQVAIDDALMRLAHVEREYQVSPDKTDAKKP